MGPVKTVTILLIVLFKYCASLHFPERICDASEAMEFFQYSYHILAWAEVRMCKSLNEAERYRIYNCKSPFNIKSLLQLAHSQNGIFFELDMEVSRNLGPIEKLVSQADHKLNVYGQKVAEGPGCKGLLVAPLKIFPKRGVVAVMFNEKYLDVDAVHYEQHQIEAILKVVAENKAELAKVSSWYIVLNLKYLSKTELGLLKLFRDLPIMLYQFEQQTLPNMDLAKTAVDELRSINAQIRLMLPQAICLRLDSQIPTADWRLWRAKPRLHVDNLQAFSQLLLGGKNLIEVETRRCPFSLGISWYTECLVLLDYLMNLSIDGEFVVLFECPDSKVCRDGLYEVAIKHDRPFLLVDIVNGPNWDGSAKDFVDEKLATANVNFVIGFREQLGKEKWYTKKHIDDLVKVISQAKFKRDVAIHMRLEFLAKKNLTDTDYFQALIKVPKFKWLFVHDDQGFAEPDPPRSPYCCNIITRVQKNLRAINRITYLLVDEETRGNLFVSQDSCVDNHLCEDKTTTTTAKPTTAKPTTAMPTISIETGTGNSEAPATTVTEPTTQTTKNWTRQTPPTLPTTTTARPPSKFTIENGTQVFPTIAEGRRLAPWTPLGFCVLLVGVFVALG